MSFMSKAESYDSGDSPGESPDAAWSLIPESVCHDERPRPHPIPMGDGSRFELLMNEGKSTRMPIHEDYGTFGICRSPDLAKTDSCGKGLSSVGSTGGTPPDMEGRER